MLRKGYFLPSSISMLLNCREGVKGGLCRFILPGARSDNERSARLHQHCMAMTGGRSAESHFDSAAVSLPMRWSNAVSPKAADSLKNTSLRYKLRCGLCLQFRIAGITEWDSWLLTLWRKVPIVQIAWSLVPHLLSGPVSDKPGPE
jgi:hypothetical protein